MNNGPVEPGGPEWRARVDRMLAGEVTAGSGWWWLSFADPQRPEGQQFLGVAIVRASGPASATMTTHKLGINPGGEVQITELPDEVIPAAPFRNRLLTRDEADRVELVEYGAG